MGVFESVYYFGVGPDGREASSLYTYSGSTLAHGEGA